jgi:hypothetical protein
VVRGCPQPSIAASILDPAVWDGVREVLIDPAIIFHALCTHHDDGGVARELAAMERHRQTIIDKQQRIARAVTTLDDEAAAAPLLVELQTLATSKTATEQECDRLRQRVADAAADTAQVRTLMGWCQTVAGNLDGLTYDEKRLALTVLGVHVRVYRPGSVDQQGRPVPRWMLSMDPTSLTSAVPTILGPNLLYGTS